MNTPSFTRPPQESTENVHLELRRADDYYERGDLAAARDCLDKARALAPAEWSILTALGSLDFQLGRYEEAGQVFLAAANIRPDWAQIHTQLAAVWIRLGNERAFYQAIEKALDLDPRNLAALRLLAKGQMAAGKYYEAARSYHRVLSEDYRDLDSLMLLGKCFYHLKDYAMARLVYERVLALDPRHAAALDNLALLRHSNQPPAVMSSAADDDSDADIIVLAV